MHYFKIFYHGPLREILARFSPKLPEYSGILVVRLLAPLLMSPTE
jgi:hypothetical protein